MAPEGRSVVDDNDDSPRGFRLYNASPCGFYDIYIYFFKQLSTSSSHPPPLLLPLFHLTQPIAHHPSHNFFSSCHLFWVFKQGDISNILQFFCIWSLHMHSCPHLLFQLRALHQKMMRILHLHCTQRTLSTTVH